MNSNTRKKAKLIKTIVDEHYQANSHKGCLSDIYRRIVVKKYPMSLSTFYRLMKIAILEDGFVGNGGDRVYINDDNDECRGIL
ncbi:MAG: hypothetical protein ACOX4D_07760 [Bacteroidales bacterium]|jgi:hypothetical protein